MRSGQDKINAGLPEFCNIFTAQITVSGYMMYIAQKTDVGEPGYPEFARIGNYENICTFTDDMT
jgi:hypothetical protein